MFNKSSDFIAISLTEDNLRAVQLSGTLANFKITNVVDKDLKGIASNDLSRVVQSSLVGFNTKTAQILAVTPSSQASTKNIEIPSTSADEIKSIVSLQAGRHTPFSREEIQTGYVNLGVFKTNYTKVLLVIANKSLLKNQLSVLDRTGLKAKKVLFAPEGVAGFYSKIAGSSPLGVIDINKNTTDFIIVQSGKPMTSRSLPVGKTHLSSDPADAQQKLADELKRTIESYQSEDLGEVPANYIFTAQDETTKNLQPFLKEKLGWDVKVSSYLDLAKANDDTLKKIAGQFSQVSFLDLVASYAVAENPQVNLIPEEVQIQKSIETQGKEVFTAAILSLIILVLVACNFGLQLYFKTVFLKKIQGDYEQNRKEVAALEDYSNKTRILQNYLESRMVSLDVINELYHKIPSEIYLTDLSLDENGSISVQGISDVGSLVYNLNTTLKESNLFKSADVKSKTAKKDRGKDVHAFEITLKLKNAVEDEKAPDADAVGSQEKEAPVPAAGKGNKG